MDQRNTLVARALVGYEAERLGSGYGSFPVDFLTVATLERKYGLDWGTYDPPSRKGLYPPTVHRTVLRNELRRAHRNGVLAKVRSIETGKKLKLEGFVVYVHGDASWRTLVDLGLEKVWE